MLFDIFDDEQGWQIVIELDRPAVELIETEPVRFSAEDHVPVKTLDASG